VRPSCHAIDHQHQRVNTTTGACETNEANIRYNHGEAVYHVLPIRISMVQQQQFYDVHVAAVDRPMQCRATDLQCPTPKERRRKVRARTKQRTHTRPQTVPCPWRGCLHQHPSAGPPVERDQGTLTPAVVGLLTEALEGSAFGARGRAHVGGKYMEATGRGQSRSGVVQAMCGQHKATQTEAGTHC
jgi:hypothetical protein